MQPTTLMEEYVKPKLHLPLPPKKAKKPAAKIPTDERKLYKEWKDAYKAVKYPDCPHPHTGMPKWSRYSNFIEDAIKMWAKAHNIMATKIDVKGTFRNGKWNTSGSTKGVEDIQLVIGGLLIAIEVKAGKDTQSDAQVARQKQYAAQGVPYHIVRTLTEFTVIIQQYV